MKLSVLIIFSVLMFGGLFGQDRQVEWKFLAQREKLYKSKCKEITEKEYWPDANGVSPAYDSSKVVFRYELDTLGYISRITEYTSIGTTKVTNYLRDKKGQYYFKEYLFYDSSGNLKHSSKWKFDYNSKGQIIKEELTRKNEKLRTNILEYDQNGNCSSQKSMFSSSASPINYKWIYKHDSLGNLTELQEWVTDTSKVLFISYSTIMFEYENGHLIREIKKSAKTNEVWNDKEYKYDSNGNLIMVIERHTMWRSIGNGPREREIREYKTTCVNDVFGRVLSMATLFLDEDEPYRYVLFKYRDR